MVATATGVPKYETHTDSIYIQRQAGIACFCSELCCGHYCKYYNNCYSPAAIEIDSTINKKQAL